MKSLHNFLNEGKTPRYCVNVIIDGIGNDRRMTDDWKSVINSDWCKNVTYYEVMDMSKPNFTDIDALIEWHGKNGYFANLYDDNKKYYADPKNAPKWMTKISEKDLKKLEAKKK